VEGEGKEKAGSLIPSPPNVKNDRPELIKPSVKAEESQDRPVYHSATNTDSLKRLDLGKQL
jgi:hypothetical protein